MMESLGGTVNSKRYDYMMISFRGEPPAQPLSTGRSRRRQARPPLRHHVFQRDSHS